MDSINLKAIHRKYSKQKLLQYKTISFLAYYVWYPLFKKIRTLRPLDYMPYNKDAAIAELERTIGWRSYGRKHGESLFTKLFQNYYLPTKFGFDKRRPHLSSLIVSGQITRDQALVELEKPLYDPKELENDIIYFCKKLRITREQFNDLMQQKNAHYTDFPNWDKYRNFLKYVQKSVASILGRRVEGYH
jgi:hypothetical protein